MGLQKFPVVLPLGGAVDEGTVTELVQPPRIQSADDCASVKGGAYQKRDSAEASDPDTGNPRGIAAAPFGIVGVTPDETYVLREGTWDKTPGNKGAQPGTVKPLVLGTDEAAPVHTCDTAVIDTPTGRVRCVVYQVGPACVPAIEVANTGTAPLRTYYPMAWPITLKNMAPTAYPGSNLDAGELNNLNPSRASYFMLVDDATDAPLTRPQPLADFDPSLVDAPKVLPLDDGFLITAWDLNSPLLIGASAAGPRANWYEFGGGNQGETPRNKATKGILRLNATGQQTALWTGDGGEIRDWVIVGDTVVCCHARQTAPGPPASPQTTLVLYDLTTDAVTESAPVGDDFGDTIEGGLVGLVGLCAMDDDRLMCVASSCASARYTLSTDSWISASPVGSAGGIRGRNMQSGGGFLGGVGATLGTGGRTLNGILPGSPSCVGVACPLGNLYWLGVTTQGQDFFVGSGGPPRLEGLDSTEIIFEYWFVNEDCEYQEDTHNYLLGACPLSRAEPDPESGLPHLYLYAGAKVWPMPAMSSSLDSAANSGATSAFNGTPVLARWSFFERGKPYLSPRISGGRMADPEEMIFNSEYQLEAIYVGDPLSTPFYAQVGNASNYRSALITGSSARYECTAPSATSYGEGVGFSYVTAPAVEVPIAYTGVAVTSALRVDRIAFTEGAPNVIDTGERVFGAGLYPLECDGPSAALGAGVPPTTAVTTISMLTSSEPLDYTTSPDRGPLWYPLGTVPLEVDPASGLYDGVLGLATITAVYHPSGELVRSEPVFCGTFQKTAGVLFFPPQLKWTPADFPTAGPPGCLCAGPWPLFGIPPTGTATIEVYQTRNGQPFELITTRLLSLEEGSIPYRECRADPLRIGYWESGEITPGPAPALLDVVSTNDRVFGLSAERPTLIYYTKIIRQGYALEWTRNFSIEFPEPLVAIAALPDGRLLGMSERAVYYTYGQGPSDTGQGAGFSVPQVLTLQTGCIAPPSIAAGDFGVIFRGPRGFYQVSRDLALKYVGLPYEDTTQTGTVVCTSIDAVRSEVHFYLEGGGAWIYNTLRGQWSSFTTGDAQDVQSATVANNRPMRWVADSANTGNIWTYSLDPAAAPALMSLQTGWLEMGRLQGFGRMWEIQIEGTRPAATLSALRAEVFYDYEDTPSETFEYDDPGEHIKIRLRTARQKCESVSLRFTEYVPPGATDAACQGWNLSLCTLLAGVKSGLDKIAITRRST